MKDYAHRVSIAGSNPADAVAHRNAIDAPGALLGAITDRENHAITFAQWHDVRPRLHAWALLGQDEFAAFEVLTRFRQQNCELQRKDMLAV